MKLTDEAASLASQLLALPEAAGADPVAQRASFRDAVERADRAESAGDLVVLLERAGTIGDDLLALGVLAVAIERNEPDVLAAYADAHPDKAGQVAQLAELLPEPTKTGDMNRAIRSGARAERLPAKFFAGPQPVDGGRS